MVISRRISRAVSWIWLVFLATACQSHGSAATPGPTAPISSTRLPTSIPVVQPTLAPTQAAQASPASTMESTPATTVRPAAAFTLTILHTGQVYGEIVPCG